MNKIINEFYDTENAKMGCSFWITVWAAVLVLVSYVFGQIYMWIR